jgi:MOSC domain-containing protein YiiM
MAIVTKSGEIRAGDEIQVAWPNPLFEKLERV